MKLFYIFLLSSCCIYRGYSQEVVLPKTDSSHVEVLSSKQEFGRIKLEDRYFFESNDLNIGYLFRGNIPGMLVTRPSGNPLEEFNIISRGLSTFEGRQAPLYIVDGMPVNTLAGIDPMDVKRIEVEQNIVRTARYGLRGSNGIIHIETFNPQEKKSSLRFKTFGAIDWAIDPIEVLSSEEYISKGGTNLGGKTDWYDEIYRTTFSWANQLTYQANFGNTQVAVSGNHRFGDLVLLDADFQQSSVRLHVRQKAFQDKLKIRLSLAGTYRDAHPGLNEASRYAAILNPTLPVLDASNIASGGYSEEAFLYGTINPVALLKLNSYDSKSSVQQATLQADYAINNNLKIGLIGGMSDYSLLDQVYQAPENMPPSSFNPRTATATWSEQNRSSNNFNTFIAYEQASFDVEIGARIQEFAIDAVNAEIRAIESPEPLPFSVFEEGLGLSRFNERFTSFSSSEDDFLLSSYYIDLGTSIKGLLDIQANYTREGSTRFGSDQKWGNFGGVSAQVPIHKWIVIPQWKINLLGGYGISGGMPTRSNLSKTLWDLSPGSIFSNGEYLSILTQTQQANEDLRPEKTHAFNIGAYIEWEKFKFNLNYFNRRSNNLIDYVPITQPSEYGGVSVLVNQFQNVGEVKSNGFEFSIQTQVLIPEHELEWNTSLQFFTFKSEVIKSATTHFFPLFDPGVGGVTNIGIGEVGVVNALQVASISGANFTYRDLNNDGDTWDVEDGGDTAPIGSGLPNFSIGWQNQLKLGKLEMLCSFYGSFGHRIVNGTLVRWHNTALIDRYNLPQVVFDTELENGINNNPLFSDFFFEKASFLRLENLTFRYPIYTKKNKNLTAFIGFNNLITLHNYSGVNPEVRQNINAGLYRNSGSVGSIGNEVTNTAMVHGKDDRDHYPFTKSIIFGFTLDLGVQSN